MLRRDEILGRTNVRVEKSDAGWLIRSEDGNPLRGLPYHLAFAAPRGLTVSPSARGFALLTEPEQDIIVSLEVCLVQAPLTDADERRLVEARAIQYGARPFAVTRDSPWWRPVRERRRMDAPVPAPAASVSAPVDDLLTKKRRLF